MRNTSGIAVLLPAYNEGKTVDVLLTELKRYFSPIILVNDGSADNTGVIAKKRGITVITHKKRKGKGAAIRTGMKFLWQSRNIKAVVVMDADGQHGIDDVLHLVSLWNEEDDQVMIGKRSLTDPAMPILRKLWNRSISAYISSVAGRRIVDSQCGLRLYPKRLIPSILPTRDDYAAESEMLLLAIAAGVTITPVSIQTLYFGQKPEHITAHFSRALSILNFLMHYSVKTHG